MKPLSALHNAIDAFAQFPIVDGIVKSRYETAFRNNKDANMFRGVFDTFADAERSAPEQRILGYDNPDAAKMYIERTRKIYPTDYPVMFWLTKLFAEGNKSVFDLGGHIGVSYYAYKRHLAYPQGLSWTVHDVPAVMAEGRRFAAEKDREQRLRFADDFSEADGHDILFALGSLQYLPETIDERLAKLAHPPKHVLLNLTPLHDKHSYFTLQSIGTAFCPYRITAVPTFLKAFESLGYRLVNHWENPDKSCEIPFFPEHSLHYYHGFYFVRES
jgi:putative methyltransferase (TIGR04325 family)